MVEFIEPLLDHAEATLDHGSDLHFREIFYTITGLSDAQDDSLFANPWTSDRNQHAFFFAFTIVTTIGYGNFAPTTPGGQIFVLIFAVFSIPVAGMAFSYLAEAFLLFFILLLRNVGALFGRRSTANPAVLPNTSDAGALIPFAALVVWIILGILVFEATEASHHTPWSHVESLYFSVVTLTTVGLGDYVPDTEAGAKFLFFWASVGLGILATFLTNLSEGIAGVGDRMKFIPFLAFSGAGSRDKSKFRERGDTEFSTSKDTVI
jgi:potassium channel subfamily K protein 10